MKLRGKLPKDDADDVRRGRQVQKRERSEFRVNDRVMVGRRPATVRGVLGGEVYVVKFVDDDSRAEVNGAGMTSRFTSQTSGFVPGRTERTDIEETEA